MQFRVLIVFIFIWMMNCGNAFLFIRSIRLDKLMLRCSISKPTDHCFICYTCLKSFQEGTEQYVREFLNTVYDSVCFQIFKNNVFFFNIEFSYLLLSIEIRRSKEYKFWNLFCLLHLHRKRFTFIFVNVILKFCAWQ